MVEQNETENSSCDMLFSLLKSQMQWMWNMMICYDELKYGAFGLRSQKLDEVELNYDSKQKLLNRFVIL